MKKRIISFLLVLCLITALLPFSALAAGNGTLDDPWESNGVKVYREGSTLYVFGMGAMKDYASSKDTEWYSVSGNIQRIVIESSVTTLGKNAFSACGSVKTIALKRDLTTGATLNMDATSLPTGADVELQISGNSYMPNYDSNQPWANLKTRLSKVTLSEGVRSIGAQAFSGCVSIKSVVIPGTVEFIGKEAFANCLSLTDVKLIHNFACNDASGIPFTIGNDAFPIANSGFNIALEISGNGAIPDFASADAQPWANYRGYLTELIVGGEVPYIGNNAFHSCEKLKNITFYFHEYSHTASKTFGKDTFKYPANKTLNVVGVSEDHAFKTWSSATFANPASENTVVYYDAQGMTVTAQWSTVSHGLELSPKDNKDYGDLEPGYEAQTPYQTIIKNIGNVPSGQLQVELSGGYPNAFALNTRTVASLAPGASATFAVTPALNMPEGAYYTTVIVSDPEGTVASYRISFYVGTESSRAARFVMRLYTNALGRGADAVSASELNSYVNMLLKKEITGSALAAVFFTSEEFRSRNLDNNQFVTCLYAALLNRTPTASELTNWVNALSSGKARNEIFGSFLSSAEFKAVCDRDTVEVGSVDWAKLDISNKVIPSSSAIDFVTRLYKYVLGRDPEAAGLEYWSADLTAGRKTAAQVAAGFFGSVEYQNQKKSNRDFAIDLYKTMMDRKYDDAGLQHWVNNMAGGMGRTTVFNSFCTSPEFNNLCAVYGFTAGSIDPAAYNMGSVAEVAKMTAEDAAAFVLRCYQQALGRSPIGDEAEGWKKALVNGEQNAAQVAASIFGSAESRNLLSSNADFLKAVYQVLFNRAADEGGLTEWGKVLSGGTARSQVFANLIKSSEYINNAAAQGLTTGAFNPAAYSMG